MIDYLVSWATEGVEDAGDVCVFLLSEFGIDLLDLGLDEAGVQAWLEELFEDCFLWTYQFSQSWESSGVLSSGWKHNRKDNFQSGSHDVPGLGSFSWGIVDQESRSWASNSPGSRSWHPKDDGITPERGDYWPEGLYRPLQ